MAGLSNANFAEKDNNKYYKPFLLKLETNSFILEDGRYFSFDLEDKTNQEIFKAIESKDRVKLITLIYDVKTSKYKPVNGFIDNKPTTTVFSKIHKSNVSGFKIKTDGNKDDLGEVGVLYFLDMLLNTGFKEESDFESYNPGNNCQVKSETEFEQVKKYLLETPSWRAACFKAARTIKKHVKNLSKYEFHHKTKEFNSLKSQGKKLTGLTEDKWNPADFFLIKKNFKIKTYKTYQELNKKLNDFEDIIGISLKKDVNEALGGSYALNNLSKKYNLPDFKSIRFSKFDKNFYKFFIENIKKLKNHRYKAKISVRTEKLTEPEEIFANIQAKISATNFFKGYPGSLAFICSSSDNFENILYEVVCGCLSRTEKSCNFYKVSGDQFEIFDDYPSKIEPQDIIVSCNGESDVKMNVKIDGKLWKLQTRSKGSLPQFMLVPNKVQTNNNDIDISKLKI